MVIFSFSSLALVVDKLFCLSLVARLTAFVTVQWLDPHREPLLRRRYYWCGRNRWLVRRRWAKQASDRQTTTTDGARARRGPSRRARSRNDRSTTSWNASGETACAKPSTRYSRWFRVWRRSSASLRWTPSGRPPTRVKSWSKSSSTTSTKRPDLENAENAAPTVSTAAAPKLIALFLAFLTNLIWHVLKRHCSFCFKRRNIQRYLDAPKL